MSIKFPRQVLLSFFLMSFLMAPIYAKKDVRDNLYKQIEVACNKNSALKLSKKKVSQICRCLVEEHKAKDLSLEMVEAIHKRYTMTKKKKIATDQDDLDVIKAYDDDTALDCIKKYE